jgi:O-antigen ligase
MNHLFTIKDTFTNKVTFLHLLWFTVFLPFDRFYSELALISLLIHTAIHYKECRWECLKNKYVWLLQSVFWITLYSSFYSLNKQEAFSLLERQLAILLLPILLFVLPLDLKRYQSIILKAFSLSCLLALVYLYIDALHIILYNHLPLRSLFQPIFINHNFSAPIDMHATFMSMYLLLSLIFTWDWQHRSSNKAIRALLKIACLIFIFGLLQLAVRAVLITLLFVICIAAPIFYLPRSKRVKAIVLLTVSCTVLAYVVNKSPTFHNRLVQEMRTDLSSETNSISVNDSRAQRWAQAWEMIKESPVIGYGSGDDRDLLMERYYTHKLYSSYIHKLKAHNQYISLLLKGGCIALVVYLALLVICFRLSIRFRDPVFFAFMACIAIVSFSDDILDVNKGIFFYSFFLSFFAALYKINPVATKETNQKLISDVLKNKIIAIETV